MNKKNLIKSHLNKVVTSATFYNRSGFGLVEVLIAMGLTAIISLTIMRLMELQTKSQNTTDLKARVSEITNIVRQNLTDLEACNATLTGATPGEIIPELRTSENLANPPLVKVGDEYLKSGLLLTSMRLLTRREEEERGFRSGSSLGGVLNSSGIGYSYLEMELTRNEGSKKKTFGAISTKTVIPVRAEFADLMIVTACNESELDIKCNEVFESIRTGQASDCSITMDSQNHKRLFLFTEDSNNPSSSPKKFPIKGCGGFGYMAECKVFHPCLPVSKCAP